jgi:hypothetical protein
MRSHCDISNAAIGGWYAYAYGGYSSLSRQGTKVGAEIRAQLAANYNDAVRLKT